MEFRLSDIINCTKFLLFNTFKVFLNFGANFDSLKTSKFPFTNCKFFSSKTGPLLFPVVTLRRLKIGQQKLQK